MLGKTTRQKTEKHTREDLHHIQRTCLSLQLDDGTVQIQPTIVLRIYK